MRSSTGWEGVGIVVLSLAVSPYALHAQNPRPWSLGFQAGQAANHGSSYGGRLVSFAFGRAIDRVGFSAWRVALDVASGQQAFIVLRAAPELRLLPRSAVTPYGTASAGLLMESDWGGPAFAAGGGLLLRLGAGGALRAEITRGTHGGEPGPHTPTVGLELRRGRARAAS